MKLYAIKPLKWVMSSDSLYEASTSIGVIYVVYKDDNSRWEFSWVGFPYKDEGTSTKTFRDAKTARFAAEAFYQGRLKKALTSKVVN